MLGRLTTEQEALIPVVRQEWLDRAFKNPQLDPVRARASIEWIYEKAKLKKPAVLFVSSPLASQIVANLFKGDQVGDQVGAQVWAQVWDQVGARVGDQKLQFFDFAWVGWGNYGWVAFGDYFDRIGITVSDEFRAYREVLLSGIYDFVALDGLAIVCEPPIAVNRDEQNRLSSTTRPCIEWKDGFKLWSVNGVWFEFELWEQVTTGAISAKDILKIENMEQRMVALKLRGAEQLLTELDAKLINKSERGNELYLLKDIFPDFEAAYFLKYSCPSTGRVYVSGVDPEIGIDANADAAMAWKHNMSVEQYSHLRHEA